ncbi:hypothetical protein SMICM17S_12087 [Streptomyces microflavus]
MQEAGAPLGQLLFEAGAHLGAVPGNSRASMAPFTYSQDDQDGRAVLGEQPVDLQPGEALVLGDAGGLGDVPDVEQTVGDARALAGVIFAVPMSIRGELHGVGVDHLTAELLGEEAQIGFSGRGGADDGDDAGG